jgi:hypothetical protein
MAFNIQAQVGQNTYADGTTPPVRADRSGALVFNEYMGKYTEAARNRLLYTGSTPAAGVVIPIYTSTTQQCVLQNPLNSTAALVLRKIYFGYVSGTTVAGHYCLAVATLPTSAITGTNSTTFITNNKLTGTAPGAGNFAGSQALLFTAATVVAMTYFRNLAFNQDALTAASTNNPWQQECDLDGSVIMMPGSALAVAANVAAAVTAAVAIEWFEVPVAWVQ